MHQLPYRSDRRQGGAGPHGAALAPMSRRALLLAASRGTTAALGGTMTPAPDVGAAVPYAPRPA